jgi:hypothetical protein
MPARAAAPLPQRPDAAKDSRGDHQGAGSREDVEGDL